MDQKTISTLSAEEFPFASALESLQRENFSVGAALRDKKLMDMVITNIEYSMNGKSSPDTFYNINKRVYQSQPVLYTLSIILIAASKNTILAKKFALGEAIRAEPLLLMHENHLKKLLPVKKEDDKFVISIADYLKRSIKINEKSWKLVNQNVDAGMVRIKTGKLVRLLRTEISQHVLNTINATRIEEDTIRMLAPLVQKIENITPKYEVTVGKNGLPPCVEHYVNDLRNGENVNHSGRFLIATWMASAGYETEDITAVFVNAPDYSDRVTKYQVETIKKRKYNPPSCAKLKTQGLCHRTDKCGSIINPIQF